LSVDVCAFLWHQILGNYSEFERCVTWLGNSIDFDTDANVSVFETNIRILGGLLSGTALVLLSALNYTHSDLRCMVGHLLATEASDRLPEYDNVLLDLAEELAKRLLPAFDTKTGIPYGTVPLRLLFPLGLRHITTSLWIQHSFEPRLICSMACLRMKLL